MNAMTRGTRRSSFPLSALLNGVEHRNKIKKYTDIGYEVVAENGYSATLAYFPYSTSYVKIVTVENGDIQSSLKLTPAQLRVLSERVGMKFSSRKGIKK